MHASLAVPAALFPLSDPLLILAAVLPVVFVVPLVFERLKIPGVVGLILAGVALGPHGLGIFGRDGLIGALSEAGLLYVMFIAGAELDLVMFGRYRRQSAIFGAMSFALPVVCGTSAGLATGRPWLAAILLGAVIASHTLIAYPVASRLGIARRLPVTVAVGGTIVSDTLALTILAIVSVGALGHLDAGGAVQIGLRILAFAAAVLTIGPRLGRFFFRNLGARSEAEFLFVLAFFFGVSALARLAGIEPILGAFLAGLALNRFLPEHGPLLGRVRLVGSTLFIPFFLLATGMLVEPRILVGHATVWALAGMLIATALITKFLASWACGKLLGFDRAEQLVTFGLSIPQAAATLAATTVGYQLGLFHSLLVNAIVILILVTCLAGPLVVDRAGRVVARRQMPTDPDRGGADRVLVPISNPQTASSLLDLARSLRRQDDPIFGLTVVPGSSSRPAAAVASAEDVLWRAIERTADGEVQAITRVAHNVATAVAMAAIETRCQAIVLGWNGQRSLARWVFGSVIDQVLEQARALVAVARLTAPLSTFERLLIVVPPLVDRHASFAAVRPKVQTLSRNASVVAVFGVGREANVDAVGDLGATVERHVLPDWKALSWLLATAEPRDLVLLLSARPGGPAWTPVLERLPGLLASHELRSFVVLYPPEREVPLEPVPASPRETSLTT